MNGECHDSGEEDRRDAPGNESKALDELSHEEILRALAGLDERLRADPKDAYSLLPGGCFTAGLETTAVRWRTSAGSLSWSRITPRPFRTGRRPATTWESSAWPRRTTTSSSGWKPDNAVALYNRGVCLARLGDLAGVLPDFDRAIALEPGDPVPYYNRGCTHAEMGDPHRALPDFDRAIALDRANSTVHHYRGMAHRELGEFDQAISDFDTALRLEPLSIPSRQARGVARMMQGEYDGAMTDFDAVLVLDPDKADALGGRGMASTISR